MAGEAELRRTGPGVVPVSAGWFVMNARDARWMENPGRGHSLPLTGVDGYEAETFSDCSADVHGLTRAVLASRLPAAS